MSEEKKEQPPVSDTPADGAGKAAVQVVDGAAGEFLDGVRAALSDLPPGEVDEILDDVRAHLSELSGELGAAPGREALAARLGTPQAYAGELRAAAGYPPPPPAQGSDEPHGRTTARLAVLGLFASTVVIPLALLSGSELGVVLGVLGVPLALPALIREGPRMTAVAELPELRGLLTGIRRIRSGFVGELQPAWWVLRALAAAVGIAWVFAEAQPSAMVLLAVLAVPVSVWLGRLTRADRRWLWLVVPLNALAVVVVLLLGLKPPPSPAYEGPVYESSSGLVQDGQPIWDIRPVDANGDPLTGVYLFDQDGRLIDTGGPFGCEPYYPSRAYEDAGDPARRAAQPYPRGAWEIEPDTGHCVLRSPAPLLVAIPTVTAPSPASATPAPGAAAPTVPPVFTTFPTPVPAVAPTPTG